MYMMYMCMYKYNVQNVIQFVLITFTPSPNSFSQIHPYFLPNQLCILTFFKAPQDQCVLPKYSWMYNLPLEHDQLIRGNTLRENCLSSQQHLG